MHHNRKGIYQMYFCKDCGRYQVGEQLKAFPGIKKLQVPVL